MCQSSDDLLAYQACPHPLPCSGWLPPSTRNPAEPHQAVPVLQAALWHKTAWADPLLSPPNLCLLMQARPAGRLHQNRSSVQGHLNPDKFKTGPVWISPDLKNGVCPPPLLPPPLATAAFSSPVKMVLRRMSPGGHSSHTGHPPDTLTLVLMVTAVSSSRC